LFKKLFQFVCLTDKLNKAMSKEVLWRKPAGIGAIAVMEHVHKCVHVCICVGNKGGTLH